MKSSPFDSKDNVAKLEKGNCDDEKILANLLPSSLFGFTSLLKIMFEWKI